METCLNLFFFNYSAVFVYVILKEKKPVLRWLYFIYLEKVDRQLGMRPSNNYSRRSTDDKVRQPMISNWFRGIDHKEVRSR